MLPVVSEFFFCFYWEKAYLSVLCFYLGVGYFIESFGISIGFKILIIRVWN